MDSIKILIAGDFAPVGRLNKLMLFPKIRQLNNNFNLYMA